MQHIPEESIIVEGLWEAPKALLASFLAKKRSVLLITGGVREDHFYDNLAYFCPGVAIEFPAWETLPGEEITPSPDIIGKRFEALHALLHRKTPAIVLCPIASLLQKVIPKKALAPMLHQWQKGTKVHFGQLFEFLTLLGYTRAPVVSDKGEFAIRGGILDLFPVASQAPYRIEFFGDEIESIRTFDSATQKTVAKADIVFLSPAKEMSNRLANITDYLEDPIIFWDDLLAIEDTYVKIKTMPAAKSLIPLEDLLKQWKNNQHIFCTQFPLPPTFEMFDHKFHARPFKHRFFPVESCFNLDESPDPNLEFLFLNASDAEEEEIKKQLKSITLPQKTRFEKGYLTSGYCLDKLVVVPNVEITKKGRVRRQKWRNSHHAPAAEFHELSPGDMVVHFHSGIGRYLGMEKQLNHLGK